MKAMSMHERTLAVLQRREHDRVSWAICETLLPILKVFDLLVRGSIGAIRFCLISRCDNAILCGETLSGFDCAP